MKQIPVEFTSFAGSGEYGQATNTDYLNKHAEEWTPPFGNGLHIHLIYSKQVHWRIVVRGSAVCKIPGRCYRSDIIPTQPMCACARLKFGFANHATYCTGEEIKLPCILRG